MWIGTNTGLIWRAWKYFKVIKLKEYVIMVKVGLSLKVRLFLWKQNLLKLMRIV